MKRRTHANPHNTPAFRLHLFFCVMMLMSVQAFSQYNVTEIITDYNGYWKTSAASVNSLLPDNSHNLLSFSFNGNRYSTGVNDGLLTARAETFVQGDYRALAVTSPGTANASTKIGLGYMADGVANGPGSTAPANSIPYYLTDGIKGLDLGTCVANLPAGSLNFPVQQILSPSIADGVPDILITQTADPSGSPDRYEFTDINGTRVGNYVDIRLTNIPAVGNWTADFYDAGRTPMTLAGGYTRTDRPIRLWTSDLSAFGITAANASQVKYFKITLSGSSDVAFVAYNAQAINLVTALLPVKLTDFSGQESNSQVNLKWETASEINSGEFIIERSNDGNSFTAIGVVKAASNATATSYYGCTDKNAAAGKNYYRLKMMDHDGNFEYSKIIVVNTGNHALSSVSMYPNPAKTYTVINHPYTGSNEQLYIISVQGATVVQKKMVTGSLQTRIDFPQMPAGIYAIVWSDGKAKTVNSLVIQ